MNEPFMPGPVIVQDILRRETWPGQVDQICEGSIGDSHWLIVVPAEIEVHIGDSLYVERSTPRYPLRWTYAYTINGNTHYYVIDHAGTDNPLEYPKIQRQDEGE